MVTLKITNQQARALRACGPCALPHGVASASPPDC